MNNTFYCFLLAVILSCFLQINCEAASNDPNRPEPVYIGSRLELFTDDYIIDEIRGEAEFRLHHPVPKEIVIVHDQPWEGSGSGYHSIFHDGEKYRMYYKAWQHTASSDVSTVHPLFCAYAESYDGINWSKPELELHKFGGSGKNNIVFVSGEYEGFNIDAGHPAVFIDTNPDVSPDARYKAILISGPPKRGLAAFKSANGINWTLISDLPIITDGAFDSQNLAFWDSHNKIYRAYWRYFTEEDENSRYQGIRSVRTAVSKDFIHWEQQTNIAFTDTLRQQLYTNQIKPYYRAPHILMGFPARYTDRGWSPSMEALPEPEERKARASISQRYGTALTETILMVSRDGTTFKRWNEAFIRPGTERKGTWTYGDAYMGWYLVETRPDLPGAPNELSLYVTESYWKGHASALRRYTLRIDGFVSASAPMHGGEIITKPLIFKGEKLCLNFSSSAAGEILAEIEDINGNPVENYSLEDCSPVFGDSLARTVTWKTGSDLSALAGKPVRIRFFIKDADLYSFRFK
jgi:hypothetical protein